VIVKETLGLFHTLLTQQEPILGNLCSKILLTISLAVLPRQLEMFFQALKI